MGAAGDAGVKLGFSGLCDLTRAVSGREREEGTSLELEAPFKSILEGVLINFPFARPRMGLLSMGDSNDLTELCEKSWTGPALEPGLLRAGREDGGLELSERRRLDPGRSPHLLAGLDLDPNDPGCSKRLEWDALVFRMGLDGTCDRVSMVLSAKDGRAFTLFARIVSSPVSSSSCWLLCEGEGVETLTLDIFEMLGVRCLDTFAGGVHCADGRDLKPGSFDEGARFCGEFCSVTVAIVGSRGSRV